LLVRLFGLFFFLPKNKSPFPTRQCLREHIFEFQIWARWCQEVMMDASFCIHWSYWNNALQCTFNYTDLQDVHELSWIVSSIGLGLPYRYCFTSRNGTIDDDTSLIVSALCSVSLSLSLSNAWMLDIIGSNVPYLKQAASESGSYTHPQLSLSSSMSSSMSGIAVYACVFRHLLNAREMAVTNTAPNNTKHA